MSTDHIRVPLVQPGTRPELAEIEGRIMAERGRVSLLYQVLLNSGPIASGWERMLTAVRNESGVPADLRELIILRVAVLNGADGVVFVADSQKQKLEENIKSLRELAVNITKQNKKFQEFPIILQYNKRDVPGALPVPTLDKYLNSLSWQRYEAVATTGAGIFDTLKAISKLVISRL